MAGDPWFPHSAVLLLRHLVLRRGRMYAGLCCSSGGFCVAGAALGALQGSDVRPSVPWSPVAFAWQAQHWVLCKGRIYALAFLR